MTVRPEPAVDRSAAALVVEEALAAVFDGTAVSGLRADSPLTAVGLVPGDLVSVGDAIALAAGRRGKTCVLGDDDLAGARTVADLIDAVTAVMREATPA